MNFKSLFFCLLTLGALSIVGCDKDDDCTRTCADNEELTAACTCVQVSCPNTCATGETQLADCSCLPAADPCDGVTCPSGFICDNGNCIDDPNSFEEETIANGALTADATWTADKIWILGGKVIVPDGITLTIEEGTVVKGAAGTGALATALIVARGGTLNANGTAAKPIIFTTVEDEILPGSIVSPNMTSTDRGKWGGIIVLGKAPISSGSMDATMSFDEAAIEGVPVVSGETFSLYGGSDAADNSGTMTYISIRHGGSEIGPGNEINGLTLGGVGSGTTIENVEIVANVDDGIEWFGGTVSVTNALVWNCNDDSVDTDQNWSGTCSNFIIANPSGAGSGMELDGPEGTGTMACNSFDKGTIYVGSGDVDHIIDWDGSTNTGITNLYIFGIDAAYDASKGIESFGGDGACTTGTWEYTAPSGYDVATLFTDVPSAELSAVGMNMPSTGVGADAAPFASWTLGSADGTLMAIGLE